MELIVFIIGYGCTVILGCIFICKAHDSGEYYGKKTGRAEGIQQMQNEAVNRGYGEWYVVGGQIYFRWVCNTIVEEKKL